MKNTLLILALALIVPFGLVHGAQNVITQVNLHTTYKNKIAAIDAEVVKLKGSLVPRDPTKSFSYNISIEDGYNLEINRKIMQLKEDRHILEVAYSLIYESF